LIFGNVIVVGAGFVVKQFMVGKRGGFLALKIKSGHMGVLKRQKQSIQVQKNKSRWFGKILDRGDFFGFHVVDGKIGVHLFQ
jgi:hypothetical protein